MGQVAAPLRQSSPYTRTARPSRPLVQSAQELQMRSGRCVSRAQKSSPAVPELMDCSLKDRRHTISFRLRIPRVRISTTTIHHNPHRPLLLRSQNLLHSSRPTPSSKISTFHTAHRPRSTRQIRSICDSPKKRISQRCERERSCRSSRDSVERSYHWR